MQDNGKSPKYHQIVATARKLFWKHGIRRVTVEEICQEAGVSKMTFYRLFDNKIELAKTVLSEVFDKGMRAYIDIMDNPQLSFREKVSRLMILKFERSKEISQEFIRDIYNNEEAELIEFIQNWQKQSLDRFVKDLVQAQQQGWVKKEIKPAFILYFLNKAQEMVTDEALLAMHENPQELIMEITHFFFYGISPDNVSKP